MTKLVKHICCFLCFPCFPCFSTVLVIQKQRKLETNLTRSCTEAYFTILFLYQPVWKIKEGVIFTNKLCWTACIKTDKACKIRAIHSKDVD
jgi:hypothetical protein